MPTNFFLSPATCTLDYFIGELAILSMKETELAYI